MDLQADMLDRTGKPGPQSVRAPLQYISMTFLNIESRCRVANPFQDFLGIVRSELRDPGGSLDGLPVSQFE